MPVPTSITDLSQTASANYPAGSDSPASLDDVQRAHASFIAILRDGKGASAEVSLASATTTDIGGQNSKFVNITGTTTITSFGTNYNGPRFLRFAAALTLTHNASTLILPTGANITTAAGDCCVALPISGGWYVAAYQRASGATLLNYALLSGATFTGNVSVPSLNGGQLAGLRNLLINGNFQINQRAYVSGTNTTSPNQYTLDRWRVVTSGQNVTFSASGNGNQITAPAGGIEQVIEGSNIGGGTYVLNWTGTATATVNGTPRTKGETFTLTANSNATIRLSNGTASLVQLEQGTLTTPFEHRPIGMELTLCQRYLPAFTSDGPICSAWCSGTTQAFAEVVFSVPTRTVPTGITVSSASHFQVFNTAAGSVTASTVALNSASIRAARLSVTVAAGLVAGSGTAFSANSTSAILLFTGCEL